MDDMLQYYRSARSELAPFLRGALTRSSLAKTMVKIRDITDAIVDQIPANVKEDLTSQSRMHIPPRDLVGATLTPSVVVEALVVSMLIDEYLATLVGQRRLKAELWRQLEKDGVNFGIWSGVRKAVRGWESFE